MTTTETLQPTKNLRNLYLTRTAVQFLWAAATIATAATNPALAAALLVLYPLWDVACTLYDLKTSSDATSATTLYINAAAGILTAIGIGLTAYAHPQYAVAIFGAWALLAGLLQFVVGLIRRQRMGGQWAMILSGLQSTAAGVAFVVGGLNGKFHIKDLGGYAIFGAVYFLIAGILLSRKR
ncbi:DUF308 domain-containing protein [Edaphobacter dinghuensis]|uniref:Membrane protein n=1 Tax=Edaphobacter dinghuensis TaxID=1560005 RepID=A0A917H3Q5_9BACT|nr:DUF308 domain-containing protein [Edaphobacter dinghuensis]GGG66613.1 membrane protein [Edaphobacter dinghuensis]